MSIGFDLVRVKWNG